MNTKTYLCTWATRHMHIFIYSNNPRILEGPRCYQWLPLICGKGAECRRLGRSVAWEELCGQVAFCFTSSFICLCFTISILFLNNMSASHIIRRRKE